MAFDLTSKPGAPADGLIPNQRSSPWLNSPLDLHLLTFDATTPTHTPQSTSPEDFNYIFQSPPTLFKPPGSTAGYLNPHY